MNSDLWHSIKKKLKVRINPILVRVWVDPLSARYEDGVVQITAPNEFVMNWVQEHLLGSIKDAAQEVLSAEVGVTIALSTNDEGVPNSREFITDVTAYYAVEDILSSINRLRTIVHNRYGLESINVSGSIEADPLPALELEAQTFDSILDAVLEAFAVSFREIMVQETDHAVLARRALYYLCARYDIPPEEVALNMDCTVSEVKAGAAELEEEIEFAIDNGDNLDELLLRLFRKD
ncbi:DnaA N-terminal domain-containing protein [Maridesulfovibrio ferrireducens]|uniref:DnaA N-terminal domain-containing protein n=1 Tax=Maridesulfovibrio ferrireducens TaxID=246191 RepID=A0A1G9KFE9_9BACT|nr:DnaA N-terminal domain-containing protein [Maridesulfovibrio ferrireducens]SDL48359.1 DnaA N-terminal domain-containing protein [Maridesulfovibrio ferrireducens]